MPDDISSPSTPPSSPPATPPKPESDNPPARSTINKKYAAAITEAEKIGVTAKKTAYAELLANHGISADFVASIGTRAVALREIQSKAGLATAQKENDTAILVVTRKRLIGYMQQAQAWARAEFFFTAPDHLSVYHIGEDLGENEDSLKQFSLDVRTNGVADALPGFTPTFLADYNAARKVLFGPDEDEVAPIDEGIDLRAQLERDVQTLTHDAMKILFTADGIWPHWKDGSAGARHAFGLPKDRPYAPATPDSVTPE